MTKHQCRAQTAGSDGSYYSFGGGQCTNQTEELVPLQISAMYNEEITWAGIVPLCGIHRRQLIKGARSVHVRINNTRFGVIRVSLSTEEIVERYHELADLKKAVVTYTERLNESAEKVSQAVPSLASVLLAMLEDHWGSSDGVDLIIRQLRDITMIQEELRGLEHDIPLATEALKQLTKGKR